LTEDKGYCKMDLRDIEKAARDQGWRVERTKKGHPVFYPPNPARRPIVGSGTPSDQRSLNNVLSELKASGLIWPWTARDRRKAKKQ
jgi:predicted RNA binding protein YcfA (HicA-like mRNA interferase family)